MMTRSIILTAIISLVTVSQAQAVSIPIPAGLMVGDQYRYAFVTSTGTVGSHSTINTYNDFVNGKANGLGSLVNGLSTWTAIVSTELVDARDNTFTNSVSAVRIFNLNNAEVASSYSDLWDGTIGVPININEFGMSYNGITWTGTDKDGTGFANRELGFTSSPYKGNSASTTGTWIKNITGGPFSSSAFPIYGISGILTVPGLSSGVPEPSSMMLLLGLVGFGGARARSLRRKSKKEAQV